jgi:hypothetical protein
LHHLANLFSNCAIFLHIWAHDNSFGAELSGLKHGHGRAHALDAGDIATGGDYATLATTNDDRFVYQIGIVPFFDRSIE